MNAQPGTKHNLPHILSADASYLRSSVFRSAAQLGGEVKDIASGLNVKPVYYEQPIV